MKVVLLHVFITFMTKLIIFCLNKYMEPIITIQPTQLHIISQLYLEIIALVRKKKRY